MELPVPIIWGVAISFIVIALAILIRLVVYLIVGSTLVKKITHMTESINSLIDTLKDKTNDIGDQTTETMKNINKKINYVPEENISETKKWVNITNKAITLGTIILNFVKMFKKTNGGFSNGKK